MNIAQILGVGPHMEDRDLLVFQIGDNWPYTNVERTLRALPDDGPTHDRHNEWFLLVDPVDQLYACIMWDKYHNGWRVRYDADEDIDSLNSWCYHNWRTRKLSVPATLLPYDHCWSRQDLEALGADDDDEEDEDY